MPVVLLLLYGYGINFDLREVRLGLYDEDRSPSSRQLLDALTQTGYFRVHQVLGSAEASEDAIRRGTCPAVLVIPRRYEQDLHAGRVTKLQVILDGSDSTTTSIAQGYLEGAIRQVVARLQETAAHRAGLPAASVQAPVEVRVRVLYNPDLRSSHFIVPGLIAIILTLLASLLTSATVVRERERGTFEALAASPVSAPELMIGKLAPYVVIAALDVVVAVATGALLFGVVPQGSVILLFALSLLFLAAVLGFGLLISSIARTQQMASLAAFLTTVLPAQLLSGFIFPVRNMPLPLQAIAQVIPTTHYLVIVRGILVKGIGIRVLWPHAVVLGVFAVLIVTLATMRFRKEL